MNIRMKVGTVAMVAAALATMGTGAQAEEIIDVGCVAVGTSGYVGGVGRCLGTQTSKCVIYNVFGTPTVQVNSVPQCTNV